MRIGSAVCIEFCIKVEAPTTDHLKDSAPNLERSKAMQIFPSWEYTNK